MGRSAAERAAGTGEWHPHGARAQLRAARLFGADRGARRARLPDRLPRRGWRLRRDVCRRAAGFLPRVLRRSVLPAGRPPGARMARLIPWIPILGLALAWELFARSGAVTPFMLPALTTVLERIWDDGASGDLWKNLGLTLYRSLAGFAVAAIAGIGL